MYKSPDYEYEQLNFVNFNSSCGLQLDQKNEWILISKKLPWRAWESLYEVMFPSNTGMPLLKNTSTTLLPEPVLPCDQLRMNSTCRSLKSLSY